MVIKMFFCTCYSNRLLVDEEVMKRQQHGHKCSRHCESFSKAALTVHLQIVKPS